MRSCADFPTPSRVQEKSSGLRPWHYQSAVTAAGRKNCLLKPDSGRCVVPGASLVLFRVILSTALRGKFVFPVFHTSPLRVRGSEKRSNFPQSHGECGVKSGLKRGLPGLKPGSCLPSATLAPPSPKPRAAPGRKQAARSGAPRAQRPCAPLPQRWRCSSRPCGGRSTKR